MFPQLMDEITDRAVKCQKSPIHLNYDQSDIILRRLISLESLKRISHGVHNFSG